MPDKVKHTAGPWSIQAGSSNPLIGSAEFSVAEVLDDCFPDAEQQQANARLIAAAPDLLALATAARYYIACGCLLKVEFTAAEREVAAGVLAKLDSVLAKAKGAA